tara:strand:- start:2210 stop:2599 length:390 start_codon:yes stop_codon:yes gene_type:complete
MTTIVLLVTALWTTIALGQDKPPNQFPPPGPQINMYLAINGYCKTENFGWSAAKELKQEPLFYGRFLVNMGPHPSQSQAVWTQLWAMVNQDTGQFSIFARMPDGMMCLLGSGGEFTPYTGPALKDIVPD